VYQQIACSLGAICIILFPIAAEPSCLYYYSLTVHKLQTYKLSCVQWHIRTFESNAETLRLCRTVFPLL